ncbi:hypothetical protein [Cupriavidus numazuensis]|uniref:hypothetical protein n=1 Tax=Cupriavidus numazuensis TaxID=221992 RepID=UPI001BAAD670|nr:hypothetical protein [Cupriavidus numazuensis]
MRNDSRTATKPILVGRHGPVAIRPAAGQGKRPPVADAARRQRLKLKQGTRRTTDARRY